MLKTILSSIAAVAFLGGATIAQDMPSTTGLAPGAPLGVDPLTDRGIVVGERTATERRAAQMPTGRITLFDPARTFRLGSPSGLSPGAPTEPDPLTDNKRVVGER